MNRKQLRRHDLHYLMSFIDFAFMVIIIFISLLSVAYFDPPGSSGVKRQKALYTVKDAQELQKLGLTPAQVKELLVIRRQKIAQDQKLQDLAAKNKTTLPQSLTEKQTPAVKPAPVDARWHEENKELKKKMALLEKKISLMKKQVLQLETQKKQMTLTGAQKKAQHKTGVLPESAVKKEEEHFGGHEFLDLRK